MITSPRADDLTLIGGDFTNLQQDMAWLKRYFRQEVQLAYVNYRCLFGRTRGEVTQRNFAQLFIDHTGYYWDYNSFFKVDKKIDKLIDALGVAEANKDFELISTIKLGKYFR